LAIKANVDVTAVSNMAIFGNHSALQFPDFTHAKINGKLCTEVITDRNWLENEFVPMIQQRGAAVIKARGASSAASAANGAIDTVYNLTHDTAVNQIFSVGTYSTGQYGADKGLIFSYPCRVEHGALKIVEGWKFDSYAQHKFDAVLEELRGERDAVKELGLIK